MATISNTLSGIGNAIGGFASNVGNQLSGLVSLPSAYMAANNSAQIKSNTQSAAQGQPYIPNYNGGITGAGIFTPAVVNQYSGANSSTPNVALQPQNSSIPNAAQEAAIKSAGNAGNIPAPSGNTQQTPPNPNAATTVPAAVSSGAAPAGYSYNGAGQLVPTSSIQPGQTNNTQASTFPGLVTSLATTASQPSAAYTAAQNQYNQANQGLVSLEQQAAQAQGSVNNTPGISLQGATGESGQIQNTLAAEAAPLAQEMTASQAAAQTATQQQSTQQSGLNQAGTLAAPQPGQNPATQSYDPVTGQYSPLAASSLTGSGGSATSALQGAGAVSQDVANGATGQLMQSNLGTATAAGSQLSSLISANNINPSNLNIVNGVIQAAAGQTSNTAYQEFTAKLNSYVSAIAQVLGRGQPTTNLTTSIAQQLLNATSSGPSINAVIQALNAQGQAEINGFLGTSPTTSANGTGNTNTTSPLSGSIFTGFQ